jgi:hypothetical protein
MIETIMPIILAIILAQVGIAGWILYYMEQKLNKRKKEKMKEIYREKIGQKITDMTLKNKDRHFRIC